MRVASRINSLMLDLKNEEKKELKDKIENEIIRVTDLIPIEIELINKEIELMRLEYSESIGIWIEHREKHLLEDRILELKSILDEGI